MEVLVEYQAYFDCAKTVHTNSGSDRKIIVLISFTPFLFCSVSGGNKVCL